MIKKLLQRTNAYSKRLIELLFPTPKNHGYTIEKHLRRISQRAETYDKGGNIFEEEIQRASQLDQSRLRQQVPQTTIKPYRKFEFLPLYHQIPLEAIARAEEMERTGILNQPLQTGGKYISVKDGDLLLPEDPRECWWAVEESIEDFPELRNETFGKVIRFKNLRFVWHYFLSPKEEVKEDELFGFLQKDIVKARDFLQRKGKQYVGGYSEFKREYISIAYQIGHARNLEKEATEAEIQERISPLAIQEIFGIKPLTSDEILSLLRNPFTREDLPCVQQRFYSGEELHLTIPETQLRIYADASRSNLFKKLSVSSLEELEFGRRDRIKEVGRYCLVGESQRGDHIFKGDTKNYVPLALWNNQPNK